ncbi:MAG TPA: NAD(P)/FAD-dependent oxidoreductase [Woeseiaceae bacterium]|nr:NAD(P)/FAD-dependent oxidoreductase [Woeseiaceae bacterium]
MTALTRDFDFVVIGAGVVGLAIGRALAALGRSVLVVDRADRIGSETSSRNSEVIHAGLYYPPESLKSRLCIRGREMLYQYCEQRKIAHSQIGKFVVGSTETELEALDRLWANTRNIDVDLVRVSGKSLARSEPAIKCQEGLWSRRTGIVDVHELMLHYLADLERGGGQLVLNTEVTRIEPESKGLRIVSRDGSISCNSAIIAAGLHAQQVASSISGIEPGSIPKRHLAKGQYFTLAGRSPFKHLVYPVASSGGLGIHLTLDLSGRARFGPDVHWVDAINYEFDAGREALFRAAIAQYYPGIKDRKLDPGYTGIRPKISGQGQPAADFTFVGPEQHGIPNVTSLFGIESPGLTASLAIAEHVASITAVQ